MNRLIYMVLVALVPFASCKNSMDGGDCIKGKYVANYCGGAVIQVLDKSIKGGNWEDFRTGELYKNCLVASFDTTIFKANTRIKS